MSLVSGTRLGPYEVLAKLGAGGMGEVYRATDHNLKRSVAIKVLPAGVATDADRLARFQREAEVLAVLNHPNIAAIYGLEKTPDLTALVMELVEGDDLTALIARAPTAGSQDPGLPIPDVLSIARQIVDALEAAHEQGIIHRDLKPANIKVRADGTVKVLDFGLAKALDPTQSSAAADAMNSPTLTNRATQMGTILGTAAYMSPEQARGKNVDKRSDIWAFGVVLYEMLTGRQMFSGDTVTDIIAAVVTREPDWTALPASTPPAVRHLLGRCLEKDVKRRLRDIGDARFIIEGDRSVPAADADTRTFAAQPNRRPWAWIAATVLLAIATVVLAASLWRANRTTLGSGAFELAIAPPTDADFQIGSNSGNVIVSPDGTKVAFVAATATTSTIWVRTLDADDARSLSGTEGASYPFWSPDSKRLAFFSAGKLQKVDVAGGLPEVIANAQAGRGGSWGEDDTILFTPAGGGTVVRVAATGGALTPVTKLDTSRSENAHYWPVMLPGGKKFIFFVRSTRVENGGIYLGRVDGSAPPVRLVPSLSSGLVAIRPSDGTLYLMWVRDTELLAQAFDPDAGKLSGEIATIANGVRVETSQRLSFASASRTGVIVWATARAEESIFGHYNRDGRRLGTVAIPAGALSQPALSPDGKHLAFLRVEKGAGDVYVLNFSTGAIQRISPSSDYDEQPSWSADSSTVFYAGRKDGAPVLFQAPLGGGAAPSVAASGNFGPGYVTSDGRFILYTSGAGQTDLDVMALARTADAKPVPLLAAPGVHVLVSMSADGRWVLISDGPSSAAVRRFDAERGTPSLGAPISLGFALLSGAAIRHDGREAFGVASDGTLKAVSITPTGAGAVLGAPKTLFKFPAGDGSFAVNADGTEFFITETPFANGQTLRVLTNWERRQIR